MKVFLLQAIFVLSLFGAQTQRVEHIMEEMAILGEECEACQVKLLENNTSRYEEERVKELEESLQAKEILANMQAREIIHLQQTNKLMLKELQAQKERILSLQKMQESNVSK